jgi:hypothetical protein
MDHSIWDPVFEAKRISIFFIFAKFFKNFLCKPTYWRPGSGDKKKVLSFQK